MEQSISHSLEAERAELALCLQPTEKLMLCWTLHVLGRGRDLCVLSYRRLDFICCLLHIYKRVIIQVNKNVTRCPTAET